MKKNVRYPDLASIFVSNIHTHMVNYMNKQKLLCLMIILFLFSGCSSYQKETNNNVEDDENIALTIDNNSKEKEVKNDTSQWPEERGTLSESKGDKSYIYDGYNFDFGEGLPKKNNIKMERDIKTDICQVRLMFPADENNSEQIDITLTYNPKTKEISDLKSNKKDVNINGISRQLSMIYNMVNSD